jgi:hypothetical protein
MYHNQALALPLQIRSDFRHSGVLMVGHWSLVCILASFEFHWSMSEGYGQDLIRLWPDIKFGIVCAINGTAREWREGLR